MHHGAMYWLRLDAVVVDWVIAAAWVTRVSYWLHGIRRVPNLLNEDLPANASLRFPKVSVIVPARNEEHAIAATLDALLASRAVDLEVLAVDDRSTDRTGIEMDDAAERARAAGKQLRVLHIDALPAGWTGKTHAMARAASMATGEWLVFTDADVVFAPDALARALQFAERERADHLVLLPTVVTGSFGERMMMGFLEGAMIWGLLPWKVADPQARKHFIGIGAFNMVRRSAFETVGGWAGLRMEVVEDMRLGYEVKRHGLRQRFAYGPGLLRIRWAKGALGVVRNLTKNAFAAFRFQVWKTLGACIGLFLTCIYPFLAFAGNTSMRIASTLTIVSLLALQIRYRGGSRRNPLYVLTFPVAGSLFLWTLLRSLGTTLVQGGVTWRGTHYALGELRKHAGPLR